MHLVSFERRAVLGAERRDTGPRSADRRASMGDAALDYESLEELPHGSTRLGALLAHGSGARGDVVDLNRALAIKLALDDVGAPEAAADSLLPSGVREFLAHMPASLDAATDALAFVLDCMDRYDAPDILRTGVVTPVGQVRLLPPVPRPGKIVAVDGSYPDLAADPPSTASRAAPEFFLEAPTSLTGPGSDIVLPGGPGRFEIHGTLAVVIGRVARRVAPSEALEVVAGYCVANDVAPAAPRGADPLHIGPLHIGRSRDTFTPLGPSLVTADEVPDPQDLTIRTSLAQQPLHSFGTKQMRFPIAELIARASELMTLEPGDLLLTGSPPSVDGDAATGGPGSERGLRDGDVVEVEIDRLGRLRNYVRAGAPGGETGT